MEKRDQTLPDATPWLVGGGEMGERIRSMDWSNSPLGPLALWPQSLRIALGICLNNRFPMMMWWGPGLINLYNDAYIPALGRRHPDALGHSGREVWAELWPQLESQVDAVMRRGESTWNDRVHLVVERDGFPEDTWFTWSYCPIRDEAGQIVGLFNTSRDDTAQVASDRKVEQRRQQVADERARTILESITDAFFGLDRDWTFTYANAPCGRLLGRDPASLIGKGIWDEYPGLIGSVFEPVYRGAMNDRIAGSITAFFPDHDRWYEVRTYPAPAGVSVYFRDVSEGRRSEAALRESEEFSRTVLESSPDCVKVLDGDGRLMTMNATGMCLLEINDFSLVDGKTWESLWPAESQGRIAAAVVAAKAGMTDRFQAFCPTLKGTAKWWDVIVAPVREDGTHEGRVTRIVSVSRDITDIKRGEAALSESEAKFRLLAETIPQLAWMANADGWIFWYNRRWYDYTGTTPDQMEGWGWQSVHDPDELPRVLKRWKHSIDSGEPFEMQFPLKGANGEFRWFLTRVAPLRNADGKIGSWFGTNTDIEEQRQVAEERARLLETERGARAAAEHASRMKDEFLATLSHELRTPLNAILGWSQILAAPAAAQNPEVLNEGLRVIERNARAQTRIIEDLLDMSRIISGKIRLDVQRVDLSAVVQSALETLKPAADAKGVRFQVVLDPLAGPVSGDPNRLQQVFWNLLANAVKFTARDGRVQVLLERVNSRLEISIVDNGEGIHPDFLPHVFDRFRQSDGSTTRRHGGLGLGLAIVKQLVELHGGSVRAKSAGEGKGATFTISLPLSAIHADPEPSPDRRHPSARNGPVEPNSCAQIEGVRILVVDDEPDARALVKRFLEDCQAVVTVAASAAEALARVQAECPDVLVSDIGMPGEDGYSLIRQIRALPAEQGGRVPAVALTAYARPEDQMATVIAGFQRHVSKPIEPAELITLVASLVGPASRLRG